jgi:ribosome maturation factor RimP
MQSLEEKIGQLILPILQEEGLDLVETRFSPSGPAWPLKVFIDKSGGVTIDQCASLSRKISDCLDTKDIILHKYVLEVSSPGLDRPLKSKADFQRKIGEKVRIDLKEKVDGVFQIEGQILQLTGEELILGEENRQVNISLDKIIEAKIIF